jgi:hypothetical protein
MSWHAAALAILYYFLLYILYNEDFSRSRSTHSTLIYHYTIIIFSPAPLYQPSHTPRHHHNRQHHIGREEGSYTNIRQPAVIADCCVLVVVKRVCLLLEMRRLRRDKETIKCLRRVTTV